MKRVLTLLLAAVLVISVFAGCGEKEPEKLGDVKFDSFAVGYAKIDITPSLELTLPLIGGNDHATRVATGVLEPLFATCAAMTDTEGNTILVYGVDTHSISKPLIEGVRAGITEATGIEGKYIQMTATHTHQGPPMSNDGYGYAQGPINMQTTIEKCIQIGKEALEDRQEATMSTAFTHVPGVNHLRYYILEDGTIVGNPRNNAQAEYYGEAQKPDDLLQIVKFTRKEGKDVVFVNWQAHYRGNGAEHYTKYGSDYMGILRNELLEKANCETVFFLGASGNLNCISNMAQLNTPASETYITVGQELAKQAMLAMENMTPANTGRVTLASSIFELETNIFKIECHGFGIGDVGFVMMPCEPFQSLGMNIRDNSPYKMTLVGTCANDTGWNGYIPDAQAYDAVNAYGVSDNYVRGDEKLLENEFIRLLEESFQAGTTEKAEKAEGYVTDYTPVADPVEYVNTAPGQKPEKVQNDFYRIYTVAGGKMKTLLIADKAVAQELSKMAKFKVTFDHRGIVVGIQ